MARSKSPSVVTLKFSRTGNPWLDAGIVGLFRVLEGKPSYVEMASGCNSPLPGSDAFPDVSMEPLQNDGLVLKGPSESLEKCLIAAYDRLVRCYFDLSSKKQRDDTKNHNFYYSTSDDRFHHFPKKKPAGAALLLFDKAARPSGQQVKWKGAAKDGRLPESHAHLQSRLDAFLAERGLKPGPPSGMLIDGENQVRPKLLPIKLKGKPGAVKCFLTGEPLIGLGEAKQTAFPLLGGSRSFMNETSDRLRIGWEVDFVGKFAPAVCFFVQQGDDLHIFFPHSSNLRRIDCLATVLQPIVQLQENLYRNFDDHLGGFFQRRSEVAAAFLHRVFAKLSEQRLAQLATESYGEAAGCEDNVLTLSDDPDDVADQPVSEDPVSSRAVYDEAIRSGAVTFVIVSATKKGNVWMPREFWNFTDVVYLARLFERMQEKVQVADGRVRQACSPKAFFNALVDFAAKPIGTLTRDQVCEAILQKRSVLPLLERHAFHINRHADPKTLRPIGPLLDFLKIYEPERHRGTEMEAIYKDMVKTATWLGENIGNSVADAVQGKKGESLGRAKGAIHRLRKTRTVADFVNEVARLQFRYGIDLPRQFLDGSQLSPDTFEEFRGFCVVAALNKFLYKTRSPAGQSPANSK